MGYRGGGRGGEGRGMKRRCLGGLNLVFFSGGGMGLREREKKRGVGLGGCITIKFFKKDHILLAR